MCNTYETNVRWGGGIDEGYEAKSQTCVELSGEACEAELTVNRRRAMKLEAWGLDA